MHMMGQSPLALVDLGSFMKRIGCGSNQHLVGHSVPVLVKSVPGLGRLDEHPQPGDVAEGPAFEPAPAPASSAPPQRPSHVHDEACLTCAGLVRPYL